MSQEYLFTVDNDDDKGVPFGPVNKENMDISRLLVDFTCWLDPSESITKIEHLLTKADAPQTVPPWQANYPLDQTSSIVVPEDLYPLSFWRNDVVNVGKTVVLDMADGTPGLTYVVSVVATAGVSLRKRQVDILLVIDEPLNPAMVGLAAAVPTYTYPLFITMSTDLPLGFAGRVYIDNLQNAPITVTLPPSPLLGDVVSLLDYALTSGTYPVTFLGAFGSENFSDFGMEFVSNVAGDDLTFEWTGIYWAVGTKLYPILG